MKNKSIISLFASLMMLMTGCSEKNNGDILGVSIEEYGKHDIKKYVSVSGTIENCNSVPHIVSTNIEDYRIKNVNVHVGDYVNKGDVLCEFDVSEIEKELAEIEKKINSVNIIDEKTLSDLKNNLAVKQNLQKSKLEQIENNRNAKQEEYNNAEFKYNSACDKYNSAINLYNDSENNLRNSDNEEDVLYYSELCGVYQSQIFQYSEEMTQWKSVMDSSKEVIDNFPYEYDLAKAETEKEINDYKLQIELYKSETELKDKQEELRKKLDNSTIYANYSGIVGEIYVKPGQVCHDKNILSIIENDEKLVHVYLKDSDILNVKEGMEVVISSSNQDEQMIGTISKINRIKGDNGFDVYISCDELNSMFSGMNVSTNIVVFSDNVDSVAKSAVYEKDNDQGKYVFVAVSKGESYVVEERTIISGIETDEYIQILDGNLNSGDKVIVSNSGELREGIGITILADE